MCCIGAGYVLLALLQCLKLPREACKHYELLYIELSDNYQLHLSYSFPPFVLLLPSSCLTFVAFWAQCITLPFIKVSTLCQMQAWTV